MSATDRLPLDRLASVGVVVTDAERAARAYAEVFGIDRWRVRHHGGDRVEQLRVDGVEAAGAWTTATGTTPSGAVTFELVQPVSGYHQAQLFRTRRGEGVQHVTFEAGSPSEVELVRALMAERGVPLAQEVRFRDGSSSLLFDTRALLGGYLVEYVVPSPAGSDGALEDDEVWDLGDSYSRPDGVGPFEVPRLHHLGIVTTDVVTTTRQHASLFDIDRWNFINWRTEAGRLEGPFYKGGPVDHEYFTGRAFDFHGFGFEVIEPTRGPSHYREDFLWRTGPGVHHLLLGFPTDEAAWERTIAWLDSIGIPLVMGSEMRGGSGRFYYLDTTERLGGFVVEATFPRAGREVVGPINDFSIDFRAEREV